MNTYVAVLRGINVSGQRMINMKELKALFEGAGFTGVMTYIQSGNIVFKSEEKNTTKLATIIADFIERQYVFTVPVLVLTQSQIASIIAENPFCDGQKDISKLHVTILDEIPKKELLDATRDEKFQSDEFQIKEKIIYLYCPDGYGMTKFSTMFFEKKLGVTATTRNWKTMNAILELMSK